MTLNCQQFDIEAQDADGVDIFDADERRILRQQVENIPLGGESRAFELWRCAHCRQLKPFTDGGTSWDRASVLSVEERDFLGLCCDACWSRIMGVLSQVYHVPFEEL